MLYCTGYKSCKTSTLEKLDAAVDGSSSSSSRSLDDIDDTTTIGEFGPVGIGETFVIHGIEYEQARNWILKNHPQYLMWEGRHKKFLESRKIAVGKKSGYYKVSPEEEFIPWLKQQVFYSKDPKDPEWHVVLEVPSKVYFEDRTCLLRSESVVTDVDEGPGSSELVVDDELIFNEDDDIEVPVRRKIVFKTHLSFGKLELSGKATVMIMVQDTTKKPSTKFLLAACLLSSKDGERVRAYIQNTENSVAKILKTEAIIEMHYKLTAVVHHSHKCHRLSGIEVLVDIIGHRATVSSTS
ncbi:hypothetical protein FRX31_014508, partial [Thalictrum thalictroides]